MMQEKYRPGRRILSFFLSAALAVTMMPAVFAGSGPAFAAEKNGGAEPSTLDELAANMVSGDAVFDYADGEGEEMTAQETYPQQFDLRAADLGDGVQNYVTPVKFQNPFGTCWGFAAIAAAETSILSSKLATPEDIDETGHLNLAEKHLAYFTTQPIDDPDDPQCGEGSYYREGMTTQDKYNMGGNFFLATSLFSSGIGPNLEARSYPEDSGKSGTMESVLGYHGKNYQTEQRKTDVTQGGQTVKQWQDYCYNFSDDWDIDHEYRYLQSFVLKESSCLPSPAKITKNKKGVKQYEYNPEATKAFKKELMEGRAISVAFAADASQPNQKTDGKYISKNWAHYTYETVNYTHGVTIVGWDDNYAKENFVAGHQPPADGAWLVKNSWGSGEENFPNKGPGTWGIPNAKGEGTGYFWLSYYDQTISVPETFEFDRSNVNSSYYLEQHDKMPVESMAGAEATGLVKMANMFTAEETLDLEQVSCQTTAPGTQVIYNIYLLPKNADGPDDGVLSATVGPKPYEFGGFHKENLTAPLRIQKGQKYSVEVIQQKNGKYYFNMQEGVSESYAKKHDWKAWFKAVVNKGESFVYVDGKYRDFSDKKLQNTLLGEDAGIAVVDNFPIKAYFRKAAIDTVFNIYGNQGTSMDKDAKPDYVYVRLAGKSKLESYPPIRWTCSDPDIVSIKLAEDNDSNADLIGLDCGIAYITASMDGVGTVVIKETVLPPESSVTKITAGKKNSKKLKVKVAAAAKEYIDGYQVAYCVKGAKKYKIQEVSPSRATTTLTKLKKGKKYEMAVRTYKDVGGKILYSDWSEVKTSPKVK